MHFINIQLRLVSLQVSKTLLNEIDYSLQYGFLIITAVMITIKNLSYPET